MSTSWQRLATSRPQAVEAVTAAVFFAFTVCGVALTSTVVTDPPPLWPGVVLSAAACAVLPWRRSRSPRVFAITLVCTVGQGALGYLLTPLLMAPLLAAQYAMSVRGRGATAWKSGLTAAACMVVTGLFLTSHRDSLVLTIVNPAAWVLLFAAFGAYVRVRREYAVARAEHADREREEEARHRVIQERMRIARELHDVVAHHLALASAQAGTAAHLSRTHPDQAFDIIDKLAETTAAALTELKATVGLLRQDSDDTDDLTPAPGLGQLPDLVEACATAGLVVTVAVEGPVRSLSPGLDLTAYRIVQEALTNVTKHAVTRTALVRLAYTPHYLTLTVTNDVGSDRPAPASASGHGFGLLGMRERAVAAGGSFHAGPRPQGGFEVSCALPFASNAESSGS
ncbi:sensor histidine kinase [Streptomyces phaeofaciens JCM 4814]|uniref:histidine kinase n=1 Tax=Streptomyces phaeofaciens TaxID=68254 RepID=A0A918M146_9ACTN|nr:sensor histidine kinase [Streptomyces phaeofaciens]GGT89821.1 two-component sensor histidine kinase [Streptomyces phaeofaciens]